MYKIKHVDIIGIWESRRIVSSFDPDVNIFIGINGTGKTTFLNILESILSVDFEYLSKVDFSQVNIDLTNDKSQLIITVDKEFEDNIPILKYSLNDKTFNIPLLIREYEYRNIRLNSKYREDIKNLKMELNQNIKLCWLSVHREIHNFEESEYPSPRDVRELKEKNTIDQRLTDLMRRLIVYQLQLESDTSKLHNKFREQVFELMLYNKKFDEIDLHSSVDFKLDNIKRHLIKAYRDLGLTSSSIQEKIESHTKRIGEASKNIAKWQSNSAKGGLSINDIVPISLINRTLKIIDVSTDFDTQKKEIYEPIKTYLTILGDFVKNKIFELNSESYGELKAFLKEDKKDPVLLPNRLLSSGEKQLIILLTEALLQKNTNYIFIADEPELSLHINWQKLIIGAIKRLNKNAQIIVATHSPEIAGQWSNNIINMENIISHE